MQTANFYSNCKLLFANFFFQLQTAICQLFISLSLQGLKKHFQIFLFVVLIAPIFSCRKDTLITDSSAKIDFSADSILFDTVFTTIGSTTKYFIIYNRHSSPIKISSLKLGGGNSSQFRMNVDGVASKSLTDITIPAKDSLFIFVAVTVNPTNKNSPLIIRDSILFTTNGNQQKVILEAWGQDAYYHYPNKLLKFTDGTGLFYDSIPCNAIWTNDKPHVIYGYALVDQGCTLTIQQGASVYLHKGATLWVYNGGRLDIQGSQTSPVTFQGDRLEAEYKDIAGQWGKIWFSGGSSNSKIDWAIIKNGIVGIEMDTITNSNDSLTISNTIIKTMTGAAIFGNDCSHIYGYNCVFANCQQICGYFNLGGIFHFYQCTFANYWDNFKAQRSTPALLLNNWYSPATASPQYRDLKSAYFGNCIIYGNLTNEVGLDSSLGGKFNYFFDHCVLLTDGKYNATNTLHNNSVIINVDPSFKNTSSNDYELNNNSSAIDKGSIPIGAMFPYDLNGNPRNVDAAPDIGAYEYK